MLDPAARQQPADLGQLVDDGGVGVALLALAIQDMGAAKNGRSARNPPSSCTL